MLTGIKDTDREILKYIDDSKLLKICTISKIMYYKVCNDDFLRRRLSKYPNIEKYKGEESWKSFFSNFVNKIEKMKRVGFIYTEGDFKKQYRLLFPNETSSVSYLAYKASEEGELTVLKHYHSHGILEYHNSECLKIASQNGHLNIVKFLIEKGLNVHSEKDAALRYAIRCGHYHIFDYLISKGANIHVNDDAPLRIAAMYGHYEIVKYLVQRGANIVYEDNACIHFARKNKHFEIVRYLNECLIK